MRPKLYYRLQNRKKLKKCKPKTEKYCFFSSRESLRAQIFIRF